MATALIRAAIPAGAKFILRSMFKPFAMRGGTLITGQQQNLGAAAAELTVQTLGR